MVLEAIVVPESWEQHPRRMFIIGFIYSTIGIFLGLWVFGKYASISGIFLTTIPLVVIMYRAINCEADKDMKLCREYLIMKEHMHILWFFLYLFLGMVLAYGSWFTLLPQATTDKAFSSQIETITALGTSISATGLVAGGPGMLGVILSNNFRVLAFCILFSFIYGAGAIFILAWNASVIGVAIGNVVRTGFTVIGSYDKMPPLIIYFNVLPVGLSYLIHGIPEIMSYFIGALGGGIISSAVACHHYRSPEFKHIVYDSIDLIVLSAIVLVAAAYIEVYITPLAL
jgi:uncharacterized membrane protein SpoIIM required for sporulation